MNADSHPSDATTDENDLPNLDGRGIDMPRVLESPPLNTYISLDHDSSTDITMKNTPGTVPLK